MKSYRKFQFLLKKKSDLSRILLNTILECWQVCNNGDREMDFGPFDGLEDDEYNGMDFVALSRIFTAQDDFFLWRRGI